jgi:simple sugar transport system ATP-binding protein
MPASEATVDRLTKAIVGERTFSPKGNTGSAKRDEKVLELKHICARNDKGVDALKDISMDIHAGEIFGIAGVAGNGQKELAEVITGLRKVESGIVEVLGEDVTSLSVKKHIEKEIAFIPEDRLSMGLVPEMTMDENRILKTFGDAKFSKYGILKKKAISAEVDAEIIRHEIKIAGKNAPVSLMSGGNQQKLIIAREISKTPKLLIAAYPSRGLDMGAAEAVRQILLEQCKQGVAVLLISEELDELFQMSDRIGVLCEGEMMAILNRNEADYETIGRLMSGERYEV